MCGRELSYLLITVHVQNSNTSTCMLTTIVTNLAYGYFYKSWPADRVLKERHQDEKNRGTYFTAKSSMI